MIFVNPVYGTHINILKYIISKTEGSVVECGVGEYSTHFLHDYCKNHNRYLLSLDNDGNWLNRYTHYTTNLHKIEFTPDWQHKELLENKWNVAFIDQNPGLQRIATIKQIINNVDYFVIHDIENEDVYHWSEIHDLFKYKFIFNKLQPQTAVYSNIGLLDIESANLN